MVTDLQIFIAHFTDFKKHVLQGLASSNKGNQSIDFRDTKHLHNIISNLQVVIKSKDQIINLLRSDMKTLQDQININECSALRYLSSICNRNQKRLSISQMNIQIFVAPSF